MSVEITAGGTCQGELREREHADPLLSGDGGQLKSGRKVMVNISQANRRRGGRHFNESVIHAYSFLPPTGLLRRADILLPKRKSGIIYHFSL